MRASSCKRFCRKLARAVEVESIRCLKEPVQSVQAGQICSIGVKLGASADAWLKAGGQIRRGMLLADLHKAYRATRSFMAEIWTADGTKKEITTTYQPLINCHHIRQAASIQLPREPPALESPSEMKKEHAEEDEDNDVEDMKEMVKLKHQRSKSYPKNLQKGERIAQKVTLSSKHAKLLCKFLYHPEYLELGSKFVIADASMLHAFGEIKNIFYDK